MSLPFLPGQVFDKKVKMLIFLKRHVYIRANNKIANHSWGCNNLELFIHFRTIYLLSVAEFLYVSCNLYVACILNSLVNQNSINLSYLTTKTMCAVLSEERKVELVS